MELNNHMFYILKIMKVEEETETG